MPEIEIRPVLPSDIAALIQLDHSYTTNGVWQMEFNHDRHQGRFAVDFHQVRLPRPVRYDYPRPPSALTDDWAHLSGLLVATVQERPIAYTSLVLERITQAVWIPDLVVDRPLRRQGIGSALLLAALDWANTKDSHNLVLEMQPRNGPAVNLALKLGFEFCGYNDFYYPVNEIGIFFRKSY